jgi:putative FmdB family regulatory protein
MPTYEYRCHGCDYTVDVIKSFTDDTPEKCRSCHAVMVKVITAPPAIFRGTGWGKDGQ